MKILVINCGSSTIKFQFIDMEKKKVLAKGRADMIGYDKSNIIYKNVRDSYEKNEDVKMPTHKEAMEVILTTLMDKQHGVIESIDEYHQHLLDNGKLYPTAGLTNDEKKKLYFEMNNL